MSEYRELWWPSPSGDLGHVVTVEPPGGFRTVHGATLERLQFCYESWGELSAARDNVVLIVHPLASDPHATGEFAGQPRGWWEPLIGPSRAIDTDSRFVVCPNLLGGCYGTTGPRFPDAEGAPWLERFALLTPLDMMRAQRLFLAQLGIERLRMVIGPSMGGMIAWEWAIEAGELLEQVVVVAAPLTTTPLQIGWNWLQRRGIELDLQDDAVAARWGQMIARALGMLTYRSPVGLDQRFRRDWFKPPGSTLGERGMFNIESWLRHHGKRAVKRYDPYTYMLFSRAMDLHDVGRDRGGPVAALDRVRCPVTVVGISSDQLYPADQVHVGADVLERLGKPVRWELIGSPHGHDAFLLETDQLAAILRGAPRPASAAPVGDGASARAVRLGILGAGRVAESLLPLLVERHGDLIERFGLRFELAGVAEIDSTKTLGAAFDGVDRTSDPLQLVGRDDLDVVLDLTRGGASRPAVELALSRGRAVVTPNKQLVREHGAALERVALQAGVRLAYHNSIAAGWPLLYAVERPLGRSHVAEVRALLSSSCTSVLEQLENGTSLEQAVRSAREAGLTEPDVDLDLSGWDAAQKLLILVARACGRRFDSADCEVRGVDRLDPRLVRGAREHGVRVRLIGLFVNRTPDPVLGVFPAAVPEAGTLGSVRGPDTAVELVDRDGGEMLFSGSGAGELPVASAVLADLVGLFDPRQSWTGRYPRAQRVPRSAEFGQFLYLDDGGRVLLGDRPQTRGVPLLDTLIHPRDAGDPD